MRDILKEYFKTMEKFESCETDPEVDYYLEKLDSIFIELNRVESIFVNAHSSFIVEMRRINAIEEGRDYDW